MICHSARPVVPAAFLCRGLYHPTVQNEAGGWVIDPKTRYLWEDVPHGLCAMKGVAQLMGVQTPSIDRYVGA